MRFNSRAPTAALCLTSLGMLSVLTGCGGGSSTNVTPFPPRTELTPACSDPAPINDTADPRTTVYFVVFNEKTNGTQVREKTLRLAAKHGFTPEHIYEAFSSFAAPLTPEQVARLRCEPEVESLAYAMLGGGIP